MCPNVSRPVVPIAAPQQMKLREDYRHDVNARVRTPCGAPGREKLYQLVCFKFFALFRTKSLVIRAKARSKVFERHVTLRRNFEKVCGGS